MSRSPVPARSRRRSWRRTTGLAATASVLLAACSLPQVGSGEPGSSGGPDGGGAAPAATCPDLPDVLRDRLAVDITAALQKRDRAAFLGLATAPGAESAMRTWWQNMTAMGFTTGGAEADDDLGQSEQVGPVSMRIGVHLPGDATPPGRGGREEPSTAATRYRLDVEPSAEDPCRLGITSWEGRSNAPYDEGPLYVQRTDRVVVAGAPAQRADVDRVARLAERAADWLFGFYRAIDRPDDVKQSGFVVFVPGTEKQALTWFQAPTADKPRGWTGDVGAVAGKAFPLPGVEVPETVPGAPRLKPISITGESRVAVTRTGLGLSDAELTSTLVHEFAHVVYHGYDLSYYLGGDPAPASTVEGAATFIEAVHDFSPDDPTRVPTSAELITSTELGDALRGNAASFPGRLPTDEEIYGDRQRAEFYYALSATAFVSLTDDTRFNVQSIRYAYLNGGGPFSGVLEDNSGGTLRFGAPGAYERSWRERITDYL